MKVVEKLVSSLLPYENNNKIHTDSQINQIANSIKEFWFTQPIVIDKNGVIIIWHWRLEWAKKLGFEKVPCLVLENLTKEQETKLRILDNKLNESEWDLWNLKFELDSLPDFNFWDLELKVGDLFPELETPEFDPNEFQEEEPQWKAGWVCVKVFVEDWDTADRLKKDLTELWYTNFK